MGEISIVVDGLVEFYLQVWLQKGQLCIIFVVDFEVY